MRVKKWLIPVLAAGVAVVGAVSVILLAGAAGNKQSDIYGNYLQLKKHVRDTALTVTEDGQQIGVYPLSYLGILENTQAAVDAGFGDYERMPWGEFSKVSAFKKIGWLLSKKEQIDQVSVVGEIDLNRVMKDLLAKDRVPAKDACIVYEEGAFRVDEEEPGTVLDEDFVRTLLADTVKTMTATLEAPGAAAVELTEHASYFLPGKTAANGEFDFDAELNSYLEDIRITMNFHGETEVLTGRELRSVLDVADSGELEINEEELDALVGRWHQNHRDDASPYLLDAYVGGIKPIDFLYVDYEVNKEAVKELLVDAIISLQPAELEAVWYCWRKGEAFSLGTEYVEIDIPNQKMTYFKDGEVMVSTDVVTGATWGYPTPPGLYKVENKDTNCWLSGEDYNVHVDYWIGFVGYTVGIHDADWRTKFGGTNYVRNGSHGCVNTPKEATKIIFDNIEVGVPVLVYGK